MSYCDYSFNDLFEAARGRPMDPDERAYFDTMSQDVRNEVVRKLVHETNGRFACRDVVGDDGEVYTSFWMVEKDTPESG